ncbi:Flagellar hook protein FlgE [Halomonas sp. THAF5a]|uniref:flagellar hook-basal body complex protein n=1 Tax=Halomonas sp. THAF5a TaxID=2587844 RepID=UPI001267C712|nr:flagellar hook-basal body complex protein [Halomonas sp. THAF5a]QFU00114.1 Flagellar hook protein FlgE [Halomonas sp. THAF5a]
MGFSQALSGLNAASSSLDVLGNNIANSQTVGYKSSSAQFASVFAGAKGLGTKVSTVMQDFGAGNIEATGRSLDLAISGQGFYRFQQDGEVVYSRNGQLSMTADGFLENAQGARLMGYGLNAQGEVQVGGQPEVLNISSEELAARATSDVFTTLNLDARNIAGDGLSQTQVTTNLKNPENIANQEQLDYHYANNFSVYDSLGQAHSVSIYYEKRPEAENSWLAKVVMDGYYDMKSDPVGKATGEVTSAAEKGADVSKSSADALISSMKETESSLSSLKAAMSTAAATAAAEPGADADSVRKAVNDAAGQFASSAGFTLSDVLDKYLNGQKIEPAQNAVLAAYVDKINTDMDAETTSADVVTAVDNVDPMTEATVVSEFGRFVDSKSASIISGSDAEYSEVATSSLAAIKSALGGSDISTDVASAQGIDVDADAATVAAVQKVVSNVANDALIGINDPEIISAVNAVEAADDGASTVSAIVTATSAADPGEAFEAFGTNDFVVEFNEDGTLKRVGQPELTDNGIEYSDVANNAPQISFASDATTPLGGATNELKFNIDLGNTTQFGNNSQVGELTQNGYASGSLVGITIEDDGTVMRNYTNEQSQAAGQIVLANFRNPEGLKAVGDNAWTATEGSGQELVGVAGTGLLGSIQSGAIETSNVDLAKQLVDMIVTQRAYQANSQTIKTQDEVLQASINLSR